MKQLMLSETWLYKYRFIFGYLLLATLALWTLFYRLGSLLPGINSVEAEVATTSMDIGQLGSHPVNFIYHLLQYASTAALGPTPFAIRLPGVLLSIIFLLLFFYVIKHRFSKRAAIVTTLLLATSSWFLNTTRLGTPATLSMLLVLLLIFITTKLESKYNLAWLVALATTVAVSFYSPYFIYLTIAGVLLSLPLIKTKIKPTNNRDLYIAGGIFILLIAPLVFLIVRDFDIAKQLLAIPANFPNPSEYFNNITKVLGHVIWKSETMPILHLGTLPMLEIFSVSMVALGLYHYDHELSKNLSRLVLGGLATIVILLAVNADQLDFALFLPFVYFVLAGGLVILFTQWNEIFPKNPIARIIAIIPISILLFVVGSYHIERYFVAWPNTPEVVAEHSEAYTKIYAELEQNSAYTAVLSSENEVVIMKPLALEYKEVMFVSDISKIEINEEERRLIITNYAFELLPKEAKEKLGSPSRIVPSAYSLTPTTLWIYDVSL